MSTPNTVFTHPSTPGSLGENSGLSTSNTENLKTCYPDSPIHKASNAITIDGVSKTLDPSKSGLDYKQFYFEEVMRGESHSSDFGKQDMSYGTSALEGVPAPPKYDDIRPEGSNGFDSSNAGSDGSSISKSGLGPNVSSDKGTMADVKPNATQPNPFDSSKRMTKFGSAEETPVPSVFDKGDSPAFEVGEGIGNSTQGQSTPVAV